MCFLYTSKLELDKIAFSDTNKTKNKNKKKSYSTLGLERKQKYFFLKKKTHKCIPLQHPHPQNVNKRCVSEVYFYG
jgi:hypothetical protein